MKWLIKYLNLYACNRIRTITADTESKNGTAPTENTSAGETGVKENSNRNGIRLTATAMTLHFKSGQWKMVSSHIIINRINIFSPCFSNIFGINFCHRHSRIWKITSYIKNNSMVQGQ